MCSLSGAPKYTTYLSINVLATVCASTFNDENTASYFVKQSTTTKALNVALQNPCPISALGSQCQWVSRELPCSSKGCILFARPAPHLDIITHPGPVEPASYPR
ncbi:hypothetical protein T01_3759 [Trichinella spiralis]|uniref:Uncharacterized protein n=1 Tax=Trichinella spiralis TaxID=6334 RepID=A0A0V1BQ84_TRISP|nr:hypothetical protein T01_3759 [Trichinella spiralis]